MVSNSPNKWIITFTVMLGTIMSALDMSIVNVALPFMKGNLGASVEEITWVATGYILSIVIVMPIIGMLSARFGRKNFYLFSIILFTVGSMLCGMAWNLSSMIVFRVLQGVGGGALIPVSQAVLRETFSYEEQGMAMGIYGFGVVLGPAFGPMLGGWLTDHFSWPWIFYVNVPIGILNILMVTRFIQDPPYLVREKGKIDIMGLTFMAVGLGALQIMLEKGEQKNWFSSDLIIYLAIIAVLGLLLFVIRELVTDRPAVDLRILKDLNFTSGTLIGGILGMASYGSLFLLPMFLQQLLGYPAYDSGLTLMPRSLATALSMPIAGRFYNRLGPRKLVGVGLVVSAVSFYQLASLSVDIGFWDIFYPQFLQGMGFGMIFVALSTAALSTIEKRSMTAATGLYNVVRQVFGSVGIAIAATQLTSSTTGYHSILVQNVNGFRDSATAWVNKVDGAMRAAGAAASNAKEMALRLADAEVFRQAAMLAYNHLFFLVTFLFLVSLPLVLLLRSGDDDVDAGAVIE